ncbi:alpha-glucan family phosphorylase [Candidatus Woesearchaeota archaeon]|nr:alpha-glucan family phosphorylase [Candidatus Woesearchaeota archaeon]
MSKNPFSNVRDLYISPEFALWSDFNMYSGGLGGLAGCIAFKAADRKLPLAGASLRYKHGYQDQIIQKGKQVELPRQSSDIFTERLDETVKVDIFGRPVTCYIDVAKVPGQTGGTVPVFFLDPDHPGNEDWDKDIARQLYPKEDSVRLAQAMLLGVGTVKVMYEIFGVNLRSVHLNDAHGAFAAVEMMRIFGGDIEKVREHLKFTTHTAVAGANWYFNPNEVRSAMNGLSGYFSMPHDRYLSMLELAIEHAGYINAVSKKHQLVTANLRPFSGRTIDFITNGVYRNRWVGPAFRELYDKYLAGWQIDPSKFADTHAISDEEIMRAHHYQKLAMHDHIREKTGESLNPEAVDVVFARRSSNYKRPDLISHDIAALKRAVGKHPINLIYAGKAHPADEKGKRHIETLLRFAKELREEGSNIRVVFVPNYSIRDAQMYVGGTDSWLNLPKPPLEASGTSPAKPEAPILSTQDGIIIEMKRHSEGKLPIGRFIGEEESTNIAVQERDPAQDARHAAELYDHLGQLARDGVQARDFRGKIEGFDFTDADRMVQEYQEVWEGTRIVRPLEDLVATK